MFSWFHYLDKCVLLEIQLRFQENVLLCIYVFELVVRLKRLGRDFFSCESPDLEPWLFLSFNGLHVRLPNALGRDIWGLHDQRVRKGRQCLSSCTLKSPPQALFLNLKSRITLLARKQVISIEVSHVALRPFKQTHFPLWLKPQSFTVGNGYWSASIICGEILRCGTYWIWLLSSAVLEIPGWCHWQTCAKNHCKGIRLGWLLKSLAKSQHVADIFGEVIK